MIFLFLKILNLEFFFFKIIKYWASQKYHIFTLMFISLTYLEINLGIFVFIYFSTTYKFIIPFLVRI